MYLLFIPAPVLNNIPFYRYTSFLSLHSSIDEHLGGVHCLVSVKSAAVSISVYLFTLYTPCENIFKKILLGMLRSGVAELYGKSTYNS